MVGSRRRESEKKLAKMGGAESADAACRYKAESNADIYAHKAWSSLSRNRFGQADAAKPGEWQAYYDLHIHGREPLPLDDALIHAADAIRRR